MKTEFVSASYTAGQLNEMVKKLIEQIGEKGLELLLQGKLKIEVIKYTILNFLGTTTTLATTEKFIAKEKFHQESKEIEFFSINKLFRDWFLSGDGKIEEPICEQTLICGKFVKGLVDGSIIEELKGEEKAETTLTELYDLLRKQPNGEDGILLTNGYCNVFFIRDSVGSLCSVSAHWDGDIRFGSGWIIDAASVENLGVWGTKGQVFSRN